MISYAVHRYVGISESLALGIFADADKGILLFDDLNLIKFREDDFLLTRLYHHAGTIHIFGSGDGGTWRTVQRLEVEARVLDGLAVSMNAAEGDVGDKMPAWLKKIRME